MSQCTCTCKDQINIFLILPPPTALHLACACGHVATTEMLLERGSVVAATDYHGSTPLHMACVKGHQRIVVSGVSYLELDDFCGEISIIYAYIAFDNC